MISSDSSLITLKGATIAIPLILSAWLTQLTGMVWVNGVDGDATSPYGTSPYHWGYNGVKPDIDLSSVAGFGWWTELNPWYDNAVSSPYYNGAVNHDPYNIAGSEQAWNPDTGKWSCAYKESISLPSISVELDLGHLALPILGHLISGNPAHIWLAITKNQNHLHRFLNKESATGLTAGVLFPAAFGYTKFYADNEVWDGIELDANLIVLDLGSLL